MTITAKYAGKCSVCGGKIHAGEQIEWAKGDGARHPACDSSAKGTASAAPAPGAHQISGRRTGRSDRRYEVGQTIHAPKVSTLGGGPDQHYYTVLSSTLSAPYEDMGHYDWTETAWVRAATDAEAAPVAARITARTDRATEIADLRALFAAGRRLSEEDAETVASEQSSDRVEIVAGVHGSGREWISFADAEHMVWVHGGRYDDYRVSATWLPRTPEMEARVRALAAK